MVKYKFSCHFGDAFNLEIFFEKLYTKELKHFCWVMSYRCVYFTLSYRMTHLSNQCMTKKKKSAKYLTNFSSQTTKVISVAKFKGNDWSWSI